MAGGAVSTENFCVSSGSGATPEGGSWGEGWMRGVVMALVVVVTAMVLVGGLRGLSLRAGACVGPVDAVE
jgi:hypothetical protein